MACQFTDDEITELVSLVETRLNTVEAGQTNASHSNQALMQDEIDMLLDVQTTLENAAAGACVFNLLEINELVQLVEARLIAAVAAEANAKSHSNKALMQTEIDLLESIKGKLEAAAATAAMPPGFSPLPGNNNNAVAAANAAVVNAAVANAAANAAVTNAAVANAAAANAAVSYSNNYHPLGGRRRRHARKTRKARKGRKTTRKGRKTTRKGRKGSRRA